MEQQDKACKYCTYYVEDDDSGECRALPPQVQYLEGENEIVAGFPPVLPHHWCGIFQRKTH